eukprot:796240-Amphidinium_carterae.1
MCIRDRSSLAPSTVPLRQDSYFLLAKWVGNCRYRIFTLCSVASTGGGGVTTCTGGGRAACCRT